MNKSDLCLVLNGNNLTRNRELLAGCRDMVDMVEVRADLLDPGEIASLSRFPEMLGKPAILTVRRVSDGGRFAGTEEERSAVYRSGLAGSWAYVDLETDWSDPAVETLARERGVRIIRSFHDFSGVPEDLVERVLAVKEDELPKAAVLPRGTADVCRFLEACHRLRHREKIILGMDEYATATRILAAKIGSRVCYCSLPPAQGRLDPETLSSVFRFRDIGERTRVFGIIGQPIAHSFSPLIHNRGYHDLEIDAVYVPFLVDDPAAFLKVACLLNLDGFSVTLPHKSAVIPLLTEVDPLVALVGACNTVVRRGNDYCGYNSDVRGFIEPLYAYFPGGRLVDVRATVIGAGGVARAAVHALKECGARTLILNRTPGKAEALAREAGAEAGPLTEAGFARMREYRDLIVQTTQVGMYPHTDADPLEGYDFTGTELVYDLIYTPRLTRLLQRALEKGCKVLNGEEMFMAQAHEQFRLFTGMESTFRNKFLADFGLPLP